MTRSKNHYDRKETLGREDGFISHLSGMPPQLQMKITFIGTSHGVPSSERHCSCTMIEVGEKLYFIDAGAPLPDSMLRQGKKVNDIRAVFTTHVHGDHIYGLFPLCDLVSWHYKKAFITVFVTEQELIPLIKDTVGLLSGTDPDKRINYELTLPDKVYSDDLVRVSFIPTKHKEGGAKPSYAIRFEAEGKKLIFTGDLSGLLSHDDFPKEISQEETDLVVCEMAHFGVEHIYPHMQTAKTKNFCFTHVCPLDKYDMIEEIKNDFPFSVITPKDGDTVEL